MWVAMRSRNQRSWLMMTAQPAKSSSASSSARRVSTSRSLVGSSSSSTLAPDFSIFARCTRLRSPPDSWPTFFCWSAPLKLNAEQDLVVAAGDFLPDILLRIERITRLVDVAEMHALADGDRPLVRRLLLGD